MRGGEGDTYLPHESEDFAYPRRSERRVTARNRRQKGLRLEQRITAGLPLMPFVLLEVRFFGSPQTLTIQIMERLTADKALVDNQPVVDISIEIHPKSQNRQILDYLMRGNEITPIDALNLFGCFRLGARIYDLRAKGYPIQRELRTTCTKGVHKCFAVYYIKPEDRKEK